MTWWIIPRNKPVDLGKISGFYYPTNFAKTLRCSQQWYLFLTEALYSQHFVACCRIFCVVQHSFLCGVSVWCRIKVPKRTSYYARTLFLGIIHTSSTHENISTVPRGRTCYEKLKLLIFFFLEITENFLRPMIVNVGQMIFETRSPFAKSVPY